MAGWPVESEILDFISAKILIYMVKMVFLLFGVKARGKPLNFSQIIIKMCR